jgi:undecaprenyl-diphosphatase
MSQLSLLSRRLYGFLAYAIARGLQPLGGRAQFEVVFWATLLILFIGFSRLFLGVHYLSDVLAGLLVGGFWLLVGFALSEWGRSRATLSGSA